MLYTSYTTHLRYTMLFEDKMNVLSIQLLLLLLLLLYVTCAYIPTYFYWRALKSARAEDFTILYISSFFLLTFTRGIGKLKRISVVAGASNNRASAFFFVRVHKVSLCESRRQRGIGKMHIHICTIVSHAYSRRTFFNLTKRELSF